MFSILSDLTLLQYYLYLHNLSEYKPIEHIDDDFENKLQLYKQRCIDGRIVNVAKREGMIEKTGDFNIYIF
jgi:hypothetical protein